ncbi:MAG TPA: prepilin-type N-terminal cleavage/methylation domain-containing protein [Gemmatimonadales bacterium]|nr:prepilin-type N-terminal cleavage/methylation domain-containing protein [Gemmatimonadales bacterium]
MLRRTRSCRPCRADLRGLSLVEVMVAVVLLGIGTTLLATALARAMASVAGSRLDVVAATLQQSRIEQLRALSGDRCATPLGGVTEAAAGLTERWGAHAVGTSLEIVDTLVRSGAATVPLRTLLVRLPCQ